MDWIGNNWIWLVFIGGMIAMHLFGHRGHRHGSGHGDGPNRGEPAKGDPVRTDQTQMVHDHVAAPQAGEGSAVSDRTAVPISTPANRHHNGF